LCRPRLVATQHHQSGQGLAYVFGQRKDEVFLPLEALGEPFGIRPDRYSGQRRGAIIAHILRSILPLMFAVTLRRRFPWCCASAACRGGGRPAVQVGGIRTGVRGVIEAMPHWAGASVDGVKAVQSAAEIVRELIGPVEQLSQHWSWSRALSYSVPLGKEGF
jgi:hypothetical protein